MDTIEAHEFNNQLGIVIGFTQLIIAATPVTDPRYDDLLEVLRAAQACVEMLQGANSQDKG